MALQSQINPHFYYNSLASIIVLAESNLSEDVVTLCRNLSSMMRYITKDTQSMVTVREEIEYIQKYLYCMKIRYQTSLIYEIRIEPPILELRIPKLIIQPLVENAIKYGTNCDPPWKITILGTMNDDFWRIDVMDSGPGFSEETIGLLEQKIQDSGKGAGIPEVGNDGHGLAHVYARWRLHSENAPDFFVGNQRERGGIVSFRDSIFPRRNSKPGCTRALFDQLEYIGLETGHTSFVQKQKSRKEFAL